MTTTTRITTPFGHDSTVADVIAGVDLTGKRAIVTGAASGIGVETARAPAAAGAEVTLAVRNLDAGRSVAQEIGASTGNPHVRVSPLELTDRTSVAELVQSWDGPLHILVNNAGIMALPELTRTREGWEVQFATNHLGHFALALGLHDALAAAGGARVVVLSSNVHLQSDVVFDDINYDHRPYDPWEAYGQSKTSNVLFAVHAARRWASDGITANALMPGGIKTGLDRHQTGPEFLEQTKNFPYKSIEQGAATSVLLAASPLVEGVSGRYFEDGNEAELNFIPGPAMRGVRPYALDPTAASRLWDVSLQMLAPAKRTPRVGPECVQPNGFAEPNATARVAHQRENIQVFGHVGPSTTAMRSPPVPGPPRARPPLRPGSSQPATTSPKKENLMSGHTTLEARIQHLEDIEDIKKLTATYGLYVNKGWNGEVVNFDKLPDVFAVDARWQADAMNADVTGIDNIISLLTTATAPGDLAMHSFTNPIINVDGDTATGSWLLWVAGTDGEAGTEVFQSEDLSYTRTPHGWRIQALNLHFGALRAI